MFFRYNKTHEFTYVSTIKSIVFFDRIVKVNPALTPKITRMYTYIGLHNTQRVCIRARLLAMLTLASSKYFQNFF